MDKCALNLLASTTTYGFANHMDVMGRRLLNMENSMKVYSAVIERCPQTGLFVGFVPGFSGAHSQGETLDEVNRNLHDVIEMLLEDGEPVLESEFVGV